MNSTDTAVQATLTPTIQVGPEESLTYDLHYITKGYQVEYVVEWMRKQSLYLLDIETDGKSPAGLDWTSERIATIQLGSPVAEGGPRAFVLCLRSLGDAILPVINELNNPKPMKLGQNIRFECQFLMHKYRDRKLKLRNLADCQIMELILRAGLFPAKETGRPGNTEDDDNRKCYGETKMANIAKMYLGITLDKGEDVRLTFWQDAQGKPQTGRLTERHLVYAAGDVIYPWYIAREQNKEVRARKLSDIVRIEFEILPILAWTELRGVCIDVPAWKNLWQEAVTRQAVARKELDKIFSPGSTQEEFFDTTTREELTGRFDEDPKSKTYGEAVRERITTETRPNDGVKELNYNSPAAARTAFQRHLKRINWPVEIVADYPRLLALKAVWGKEWLERNPEKEVADVPDWFIPEDKAVILLKFEGKSLTLARLRKQLPNDLVLAYLEYKEAAKLAGTYGLKFLNEQVEDGKVRVYFHQCTTTTGRTAAEPNIQNWPRDPRYRACMKPHPGYKFVIRDYSAIEPRLSAETSQDPVYLKTFIDQATDASVDIYCRVGEAMTGKHIDKKKDKALRQGFKSVVLGSAYNMGARKLRDDLTLKLEAFIDAGEIECPTFEFAKEQLRLFFERCPGIKAYQNQCITYAAHRPDQLPKDTTGLAQRPKLWDMYLAFRNPEKPEHATVTYVEAPCGRKRWFPWDAKSVYTEAPNAPIQACSATITKLAACLIQRHADEHGIDIAFANLVHDELVVEVREELADEFSIVVKDLMEDAGRRYIKTVPVLAEAEGTGVFDYWHKAE